MTDLRLLAHEWLDSETYLEMYTELKQKDFENQLTALLERVRAETLKEAVQAVDDMKAEDACWSSPRAQRENVAARIRALAARPATETPDEPPSTAGERPK